MLESRQTDKSAISKKAERKMMWDPNKSNLQLVMNIRDSDPYCFTHGDCFFGHRLRIGDIVISDGSKQFLFILSIKGRLEK